jgi:hypothetical protein
MVFAAFADRILIADAKFSAIWGSRFSPIYWAFDPLWCRIGISLAPVFIASAADLRRRRKASFRLPENEIP